MAGAVAAIALSGSAWAQYSKVVMFGDSMSDTHRWYDFLKATTGRGAPDAPSMPGRFSNGKVCSENLAEMLNAPLQNYSFSGATSGYRTLVVLPMGVLTQVNEYLNDNSVVPTITTVPLLSDVLNLVTGPGKADPKALHVIWTGPDDYYFLGGYNVMTAYSATANIQQAITSLYKAGARYFFVPTMPDLSITPSARYNHEPKEPGYMERAAKYSEQFRQVLNTGLATMRTRYPEAKIMSFDTIAFTNEVLPKLEAQGFNIHDSCQKGGGFFPGAEKPTACDTPDQYVFWDQNHLTAVANKMLADAWFKAIVYKP
ncbi:MAG: SGNH/GDSL hydrolase family protein [Aquabacterium sp.]